MVTLEEQEIREELLDQDAISIVLSDFVKESKRMRDFGQMRVEPWPGEEPFRIGSKVELGNKRRGIVADYCIGDPSGRHAWQWGRWVLTPGGNMLKVFHSDIVTDARPGDEDLEKRLKAAARLVERDRKEKRSRSVRGSHLVEDMADMARSRGLTVDPGKSFYKITGSKKKVTVYLHVKGGRVDLNGFCVDHPGIVPMTQEEARAKHLGRVRGQIDFNVGDVQAMDAFSAAIGELS